MDENKRIGDLIEKGGRSVSQIRLGARKLEHKIDNYMTTASESGANGKLAGGAAKKSFDYLRKGGRRSQSSLRARPPLA